jgi:hypothetical protein
MSLRRGESRYRVRYSAEPAKEPEPTRRNSYSILLLLVVMLALGVTARFGEWQVYMPSLGEIGACIWSSS